MRGDLAKREPECWRVGPMMICTASFVRPKRQKTFILHDGLRANSAYILLVTQLTNSERTHYREVKDCRGLTRLTCRAQDFVTVCLSS